MNVGILAGVIAVLFGIIKMLVNYTDFEPRTLIRDTVMVYVSSMAGMTLYDYIGIDKIKPIHAPVFTEKPNF